MSCCSWHRTEETEVGNKGCVLCGYLSSLGTGEQAKVKFFTMLNIHFVIHHRLYR